MNASDLVIQLHDLARENNDIRIRRLADELAKIDNEYRLSTHEKQAEFDKKRNYTYDT
jgi:hypothetical protein